MEYTREQYLAGECSHETYYAQFVTNGVIETVKRNIGEDKIAASTDEHFNDIPLRQWDMLNAAIYNTMNMKRFRALQTYGFTLCDAVCIAKQAARMIKESNERNIRTAMA